MDVSIILPSFNRYPLNLLSLYSLEKQDFDLSKMEVILVDDASTDETARLENYSPPYHFKYIRNHKKLGTASTRNKGVESAEGKIIIFLDAEMIVDPNFVKNHWKHHLNNEKLVVIGRKKHKLYSFLLPEYRESQIKDICNLIKKSSKVKKRLSKRLQANVNADLIRDFVKNGKEPIQLLTKKDIKNFSDLKTFSIPSKHINDVESQLGENFEWSHIAWLACGGNLSLKRELFDLVGGYDKDFNGWGIEDLEFNYRLFKNGVKIVIDPSIIRYHQEHPQPAKKENQGRMNRLLFQQKHPVLEVCIRSLKTIGKTDYAFWDKVLQEYTSVNHQYPGKFEDFNQSVLLMLREITVLNSQNKKIEQLLKSSGIESDKSLKERILFQRNTIKDYGKFNNLIRLFDRLIKI